MKILFTALLFFSLLSQAQDLQNFDESSLQEIEKQMLEFYKKKNLSSQELQEKYFLAANYLGEKNRLSLAISLLEKGLALSNPKLEYLHFLSSLYEETDSIEKIEDLYSKYLKDRKYTDHEDYLYVDVIRVLSMKKKILPEKYINFKIKTSEALSQVSWIESIVLAKRNEFKKAYSSIEQLEAFSPDDKIFVSFLQKMNKKAPKFCLKLPSLSEYLQGYEEACSLIVSEKPETLPLKLKELRSISRNTPLYEAIN